MHYLIGFLIGGVSCGAASAVLVYLHFRQLNAEVNKAQSEVASQMQAAHSKLDSILSVLHVR